MVGTHRNPLAIAALALLATGAVAFGLVLRLEDPLSTTVIPAEDPYTHMALVREHLRDGTLDPLNEPGTLYPPGMHALLAAAVVYTGADLYDVARIVPALFGALGLAGLALLLGRFESMGAAVAGVLALAVLPEAIFRTTMLSPTAVDLALLPFFAYSILQVLQGRLGWAGAAGAIGLFLLLSHPWVFGILGVAGLALLLLVTLLPWPAKRGPLPTAWGVVTVVAIVGSGIALSLSGCWGGCGPGFRDVFGPGQGNVVDGLAAIVLVGSLLPLAAKSLRPKALRLLFPLKRPALPFAARLVISQILALGAIATYIVASQIGWPPQVNLMHMVGWPLLVLAVVGLAALPFRPTPAGHVGAAIALGTLPFVVFDPFHSPFWSHRTAVYFAFGVAILCGVAIAALAQAAVAIANRLPMPASAAGPAGAPAARPTRSAGTSAALAVTGLLVLVVLAGGVYAATPSDPYNGWYRLYGDCEFGGLQDVAALADSSDKMLVITGTWQSKLVLAASADDASRMWYKPDFFTSGAERANVIRMLEEQGRPVIVVVDSLLATEHPEIDPAFLESSPWEQVEQYCAGDPATLTTYTVEG